MTAHKELSMRAMLVLGLVLALAGGAVADDKKDEKIDAKKLVGKWEQMKPEAFTKLVIEYGPNGQLTGTLSAGDVTRNVKGTYKLVGNRLSAKSKVEGIKDEVTSALTITALTDDELTAEAENGVIMVMKRVKEKK